MNLDHLAVYLQKILLYSCIVFYQIIAFVVLSSSRLIKLAMLN
uniref:Uncharacterized protein n=1 Tax=Arundo donax TaxID=35708 RepID=A0A0A9B2S0_ARUDO